MARDPSIALDDMIIAIDRIADEIEHATLEQFAETGARNTWLSVRF